MNWYLEVLKKYAEFNGRARRKEYWYFFLINSVISIFLAFIDSFTGAISEDVGIGLLDGIILSGRPDSRHGGNGPETP